MHEKRSFYINGEWVSPGRRNDHFIVNPATEEDIAVVSLGSLIDVDLAVTAARTAFNTFSSSSKEHRLSLLERLHDIYTRRYDEMADVITLELGAPTTMSKAQQAESGLGHIDAFIDAYRAMDEHITLSNGDTVIHEPVGVCGLITPWNWPINQIVLKVVPALATGNCCVLKPSEITPLSAMLFAEMIDEAGYPAGAFNLVNGDGLGVGAPMSSHSDIDMISFTGSTRAGVMISKAAADTVKRVTLELGGKSPNIIFSDTVDIDATVERAVGECMNNTGQSCDAPTRLLVERSIYAQVVAKIKDVASNIKVGNPTQEGDHLGPLVGIAQFERVQSIIQAALDEGTKILVGGVGKPDGFETGFYCKPTVFVDVTNDMMIAQEEVFGPVLAVIPFDTEEEAIEIANDTPYGLAAYVSSGDPNRTERVASKLRAGMIHINGGGYKYGSPFGGYKMSGVGREAGMHGLEDFLEVKALHR